MADALAHRGPDDRGVWGDADAGLAFGHRRLAVIDLSPLGHQPMVSASGRTVIAYNGEVYNFQDLRRELEAAGVRFRGTSDTEVILEACERWGVTAAVGRLIGMFAFALWDRPGRTLFLVRDRLGIKPLYWGEAGAALVFGSELKALTRHPDFTPEIDRAALRTFLRYGYVPAPRAIYRRVQKLTPGTILSLRAGEPPKEFRYWSLAEAAAAGRSNLLDTTDREAADQLEALLRDAVGRRMIADVPLGAFLSGGVDSSTVVALMQAESSRPVRSFSIGFHEPGYNEADRAKAVAGHLGTDHTELYVTAADARAVIPRLPDVYDEPFADSSQIPTCLVAAMTREHVTVCLSGDGGDELFAGYNRHRWAASLGGPVGRLPGWARRAAAGSIGLLSPTAWTRALSVVPGGLVPPQAGDKLHKLAAVLAAEPGALHRTLLSHWPDPAALVGGDTAAPGDWSPETDEQDDFVAQMSDPVARLQYLDARTYLPDDILTKVDRATMAVSLEARVPLIDHRIVEFAWQLPRRLTIRNGETKWLLRRVLDRHVPRALTERPKMGFAVPLDAWLRGPLRAWAESLLAGDRLSADGFLEPLPIRNAWAEHLSGRRNLQQPLWCVLMFQAWLDHHRRQSPASV